MTAPTLTFFCELDSGPLESLFADGSVIRDLQTLNASIGLGLVDLSPERAAVVRRLNEAGIPVIAWQLLPKAEGYWYNITNATQAAARYSAFKKWTAEHDLHWDGIGIDIEPDITIMEQAQSGTVWPMISSMVQRLVNSGVLERARDQYAALVDQMRVDGYRVDSYEFCLLYTSPSPRD